MGTRSRTALTPALDVDAAPSAAAKARHRAPGSNVLQLTTQQRPARSSGAPKRPAPTAPQLQDSSEGLSTLLEVAGSYFSDAHSDTSLVEAATAVADIWHQQERELRTHVSCVLRPVLHKEARLAARAAGIAAKRQERRTKVLEQGPRVRAVPCMKSGCALCMQAQHIQTRHVQQQLTVVLL